jgi:hypothetical protein
LWSVLIMANSITDSLTNMADLFISFVPTLIVVILLTILGWILGKLLGKFGSEILDKIGLDNLLEKTVIGDIIKKAEMSIVGFFAAVIRWFVYLIFAVMIIDQLDIQIVANFITHIIEFIPRIISALVVLIIGLLIVDFIGNLVKKIIMATGVDDKIMGSNVGGPMAAGGLAPSSIISGLIKLFGYLIFITAAVEILQFALITNFLVGVINYLPSLFTGILILIVGLLAIDFFMDYIQATMKGMNVEGAEVIGPILRGFLFLIITLMALDVMLINTSIFYIFLGPLAWGFAIVVAFRWGVKEAIVAYAQSKN